MRGIFSCFTRQSPVNTLQAFQNTIDKANKNGRVSSSNLNNLLKIVKTSPEQLTLNQYRKIQDNVNSLDSLLKTQRSNLHTEKDAKITEAFTRASQKLNPDAKIERANEAKQAHTSVINLALGIIKQALPNLEKHANNARSEVDTTIALLPTLKSQQKAREIISRKNFSAFGKDTAITDSLFPSRTEQVERRNGYRSQKFDHPDKSTWTSLNSLSMRQAVAKGSLRRAIAFLNHQDNFTFDTPDNTGKLELTAHQQALLNFAQGN